MKTELLCQAIYHAIRSRNKFCKMGYSRKNPNRGLRIWNFQGYQRNSMWNFQGLIKNEVEFPRVIKSNVEFPGVFVFGLGISKGSNTILWNIQGLSFVLSGISRGKVK